MKKVDFNPLVKKILPETVHKILTKAGSLSERRRIPVYLVGGVVRDLILGTPNLDIDLVVDGNGLLFARELAKGLEAEFTVHQPFLTATLTLPDGGRIDVATARAEEYAEPAALPQISSATIEDDLWRRDFAINSLALRLGKERIGELLDPCGGFDDLRNRSIRVLHERSFIDDPTRIFRAVRYQVRLAFHLDDLTLTLLRRAVSDGMVEKLSGERIRNELWLVFDEENAGRALGALERLGVLRHTHPSLKFKSGTEGILGQLRTLISQLRGRLKADLHLVSLFTLLQTVQFDRAVEIGNRLTLKRREIEKITELKLSLPKMVELSSEELKPSQISSLLRGLSSEFLLFAMVRAENELARERISLYIDSYRKVRPRISGTDLKALGIPEGPIYQEILQEILGARLDGLVETREDEIDLAGHLFRGRPG